MQMILVVRDLWNVSIQKTEGSAFESLQSDKAKAIISLNVCDSQIGYVRHARTAEEAWTSLMRVHESRGLIRKLQLRREFFSAQKKNDESVQKYLDRMLVMHDQLAAIGCELTEEDVAMTTLTGLPPSYAPLIIALEGRGETLHLGSIIPLSYETRSDGDRRLSMALRK